MLQNLNQNIEKHLFSFTGIRNLKDKLKVLIL